MLNNWLDDKLAIRSFLILLLLLLLFQNNQHDKGTTAPLNMIMVESWSSTSTSTAFLYPRHLYRSCSTGGWHQIVNNGSKQKHQPSALDASSSSSCHRRMDSVRSCKVSLTTVFAVPAGTHSEGATIDDEDHARQDDDNIIDRGDANESDNTITNDDQDQEEEEEEYMEIESLSSDQVLELIELSFFQACFALSKGDNEPLKLFIVAVMTAAKKFETASAFAMTQTVNSLPSSIGRPLERQEQELRDTWIQAIYLLLGHTLGLGEDDFMLVNDGTTTNSNDTNNSVAELYGPILEDLIAIHNTGLGLNVNQFVSTRKDILLPPRKNSKNNTNPLMLEDNDNEEDLVQLAVVTQTVKLLYTTLEVLAGEGSDKYSYAVEEDDGEPASSSSSSSSTGRGFG